MEAVNIHELFPAANQRPMHAQVGPSQVRGMYYFKVSDITRHAQAANVTHFPANVTVDFLKPANRDESAVTFRTCIEQFALFNDNPKQLCSLYLSAICAMFPVIEQAAKEALEQLGARAVDVRIPDYAADNAIIVAGQPDLPTTYVHLAQLLFCLYKNISLDSYANFMKRKTADLRAFAGVDARSEFTYAINFERAQRVHGMLGKTVNLRKEVLEHILNTAQSQSPLGQVCLYVAGILEWTEMTGMTIILENLLQTSSPVIRALEVSSEVRNLAEAFRVVNSINRPQYFKILGEPSEQKKLEKANFPILLAVAQKIRAEKFGLRFVMPTMVNQNLVNRLYLLHKSYVCSELAANTQRSSPEDKQMKTPPNSGIKLF